MMKDMNCQTSTKEILNRWAEKIYPSRKEFEKVLLKKKLLIYHGVDPTASHLHLGHSTNYLLLREFQKLGHKIILLVGDFTAQIGDPTGRISARKPLTKKEILRNCRTYKKQAGKILDFFGSKNPAEMKFNSKWLSKLKGEEILSLTSHSTVSQMLRRNMFQNRLKKNEEIYLHEFLYPLFQGYDSVVLNCDVEVGGTDQTFNMLIGRDLLKDYKNKEKFVVTTPLLINPKTKKKLMSKSEGNFIALDDKINNMYGKVMALPDEVIIPCLKLCTRITLKEITKIKEKLSLGLINPKEAKKRLAKAIIIIYYGEEEAKKAEREFERIFKEKKLPFQIKKVEIKEKFLNILEFLVKTKMVFSKSEAKRLIKQKGLKIDGKVENNWKKILKIKKGMIIQVGKRKFIKVK